MHVHLTTGYLVELDEDDGMGHLVRACFGESIKRDAATTPKEERAWETIYQLAVHEIFYVAGQLHHAGSDLTVGTLLDLLDDEWGRQQGRMGE